MKKFKCIAWALTHSFENGYAPALVRHEKVIKHHTEAAARYKMAWYFNFFNIEHMEVVAI
jgi:hypothetical protein